MTMSLPEVLPLAARAGDLRLVSTGVRAERAAAPAAPATRGRSSRAHDDDAIGGVKSVIAALDVLECFHDEDELGVSDIARRLGVAKSTAHRLLTSLCARGMADRNPETGQYRLGLRIFELGEIAARRMRLRRVAMPLLEELRQVSGCTAQLGIASGADVFFVARLETLASMRNPVTGRRRVPAMESSTGRAIAAFDPAVARACHDAAVQRHGQRGALDCDQVLGEIRRRGVAVLDGEEGSGVTSVAAPVLDAGRRAQAALALVGPTAEMTRDLGRRTQLVTVAARRLARGLVI